MKKLLFALLLASPLHAQIRESIEVNVLELEVAVLDRAGNPVEGLTSADFEVQIGGRRSAVTNFYAIRRGVLVDEPGTTPSGTAAPQTSIPTSLVILIDDTRLGPFAKKRALDALREYVKANVGANTSAMLARWGGSLEVRTRPSERPGQLLEALDAMAGQPPMLQDLDRHHLIRGLDETLAGTYGERDAEVRISQLWRDFYAYSEREVAALERTLDAIREVIELTAAFDGRKVMLYVSQGLPSSPGLELFDYWDRASRAMGGDAYVQELARRQYNSLDAGRFDRSRDYARLATAAQAAKVSFFAIDAGGVRGFEAGDLRTGQTMAQISTALVRANEQDGLRSVANETGGRFISDDNDLAGALTMMSNQFTTYYSLGLRASAMTQLERVKVTVKNRPDLRVLTARQRRPISRAEELERNVRSRLYTLRGDNPLAAEVTVGALGHDGRRCVVPLRFSVPREKLIVSGSTPPGVNIHFALLDGRRQESDVRIFPILLGTAPSLEHALSLGLKRDQYVISIAIVDKVSGETSYLQKEVDCR